MRLTDLSIRKLTSPNRAQTTYFDDSLSGFGIRVSRAGTKSFVVVLGRERRYKTIGRYPQVSLKDARTEARKLLASHAPGTLERRNVRYTAAVEQYLEECEQKNRSSTVAGYRRHLNALDHQGYVSELRRKDLNRFLSDPHTLMTFKVFFNWAVRNELIDRNPIASERAVYGPARERVLTLDELRDILAYDYPPFSDIVRLLFLTGQRRNEIAALHSDWFDGDTITLPAGVTKNKRPHTFPVGARAQALLVAQGDGLLFGNGHDRPFSGWSKAKDRLNKHVPIDPWTLHDLRRTFSTIHARIGTPVHVTERLLNHVSGTVSGVAAIYNRHDYMEEMRVAASNLEALAVNEGLI